VNFHGKGAIGLTVRSNSLGQATFVALHASNPSLRLLSHLVSFVIQQMETALTQMAVVWLS